MSKVKDIDGEEETKEGIGFVRVKQTLGDKCKQM